MACLDPAAIKDGEGISAFHEDAAKRPRIWLMPLTERLAFTATVGCFFTMNILAPATRAQADDGSSDPFCVR
jgi:hypothetical protein